MVEKQTDMNRLHQRTIRSFVRREGRLTPGQERALETLWPQFGVEYQHELCDFGALFGRQDAPLALDIGFGNGESLIAMAKALPEWNFIGIEVHRPGVGSCLMGIEREGINNARIIAHDAVDVLREMFAADSLDRTCIFYPDPWPKKRHHKRRLIQPALLERLAQVSKSGAEMHIVTDWDDYAEQVIDVVGKSAHWQPAGNQNNPHIERPEYRPVTKYERRGIRLGHSIHELLYRRKD